MRSPDRPGLFPFHKLPVTLHPRGRDGPLGLGFLYGTAGLMKVTTPPKAASGLKVSDFRKGARQSLRFRTPGCHIRKARGIHHPSCIGPAWEREESGAHCGVAAPTLTGADGPGAELGLRRQSIEQRGLPDP